MPVLSKINLWDMHVDSTPQKGVLVSNLHVHLWLEIESKTETNNVLADDTEITLQLSPSLEQTLDAEM